MPPKALWRGPGIRCEYVALGLAGDDAQPLASVQARASNAAVGYWSCPFQRGSRPRQTGAKRDHQYLAAWFYSALVNRFA